MKKICILLLCIIPSTVYSQNAVTLLRSLRTLNPTTLCRSINVPEAYAMEALNVGLYQGYNTRISTNDIGCRIQVNIERQFLLNSIKSPETVYGPYNYMRAFAKVTQDDKLVNKKFLDKWRKIHQTTGYNGAHHLISKSTIEMIYNDLKKQGKKVSLSDMQNNAPSIFHPLHGVPLYNNVFHNAEQQYYDYNRFGMKVTIISLLERIDEVNLKVGLKPMPEKYLQGVLIEAELWCKYYGLVWEK